MNLTYYNPGFQHSVHSIMEFQREGESEWFRESLFVFYPQLDREHLDSLQEEERQPYLEGELQKVYREKEGEITEKIVSYQKHWDKHRKQVEEALSEAFGLKLSGFFNDMKGNITLNPVCPRFLDINSFDIFYLNSEKGALGMALHEIVHFVWFYVWNQHFGDTVNEYESPHLKWIFSEMVVDAIMHDDRLCSINPYFKNGCVYEYFYSMSVEGKPILDTLYGMYQNSSIQDFMEKGYEYCQEHETEIRKQMK